MLFSLFCTLSKNKVCWQEKTRKHCVLCSLQRGLWHYLKPSSWSEDGIYCCGVLSGKAPHLPVTFAPGQQHLLDYGGCHLSSLSLTVKDSPVLLTKWWEGWVWSRNSLQAFLTRKAISEKVKEVRREVKTPRDLQQQFYSLAQRVEICMKNGKWKK